MIRAGLLALTLAVAPLPVAAHKVIMGIFPSGDRIEGELGFSGGDAPEGQLIEVFDGAGTKLGETYTDADGFFLFTPTDPVNHVFKANMGAGHVAEVSMPADEVAEIVGKAAPVVAEAPPGAGATLPWSGAPTAAPTASAEGGAITYSGPPITVAALTDEEREAIAKIVRDETRPLRQEISAYKEKNDLQSVLGGIGYVAGLFGVGFYLAARRKLRETA